VRSSAVLEADLTWTGHHFERGVRLAIGENGRIHDVGPLDREPTERLRHQALLPGFVNAHSHSFQRALRGHGERFPRGAGSFWSWREAMYGVAGRLSQKELFEIYVTAYREMLRKGITTVGEFHYFHHHAENDFAFDDVVLSAAREAGIRLVLLQTFYETGGIGKPLAGAQMRFATSDLSVWWKQLEHLRNAADPATQSVGVVAHSIRAVPLPKIIELHQEAVLRGLPFHMHVEEQRQEIEECVEAYGAPPMRLLNDTLHVDQKFTAVHCTHSDPLDLERFCASGGNVCITPLTEGNLGDGIGPTKVLRSPETFIALGTDSNSRISMIEEMRWLEYAHRLGSESRGIFVEREGEGSVAARILAVATEGGARSLAVEAGALTPGAWADLMAIDLESEELAGCDLETLEEALVFGCGDEVISRTMVGGRWLT
jgi:formimidoylglutamate deiminase